MIPALSLADWITVHSNALSRCREKKTARPFSSLSPVLLSSPKSLWSRVRLQCFGSTAVGTALYWEQSSTESTLTSTRRTELPHQNYAKMASSVEIKWHQSARSTREPLFRWKSFTFKFERKHELQKSLVWLGAFQRNQREHWSCRLIF